MIAVVTAIGIGAGALVIALQYRALAQVQGQLSRSREAVSTALTSFRALGEVREKALEALYRLLDEGGRAESSLGAPFEEWLTTLRRCERDLAAIDDAAAHAPVVSQMREQIASISSVYQQIERYRTEQTQTDHALEAAWQELHQAIAAMQTTARALHGERRLSIVAALKDDRRTSSASVDDLTTALVAELESFGNIRTLTTELTDLELIAERLHATRELDGLVSIKDNQIRQTLQRLRQAAARTSERTSTSFDAQVDSIQTALFGIGSNDDQEHQTMVLGEGGVYASKRAQLRLQHRKQELRDQLEAEHASCLRIDQDLKLALKGGADVVTMRVAAGFRAAWQRSFATGALIAAVFVMLAIGAMRLGDAIELQLHTRNEALQTAMRQCELATADASAANRAKSEFLANMSHEIRTPMTAIIGFAEALKDGCSQDCQSGAREQAENAATIVRNGNYLLQIVNDILDISKVESGKLTVERIACAPCHVLAEVESLVRARCIEKGIALRIEFESAIPERIRSDPTRLRQILINVIGNAIKFTERGHVSLITRLREQPSSDPLLEFDIVDTGLGMTEAQAARIFEPFRQADASTTRQFGGTGLGLTISKGLAQLLGGDLRLIETAPGLGSRFRVTVSTGPLPGVRMIDNPAEVVHCEPSARSEPPTEQARLKLRVLLAEDGPDNQRLISHILKKAGAEVTVVDNGQRATDAAITARDEGAPFDVILMDMQMPVMDGYTATRVLRERGYRGPIVALTAHAMSGDRDKCLDAGCNDYAAKPINRAALLETLRRCADATTRASSPRQVGEYAAQ